jgi:uncharacterized phiE125 gp8 family phage protein
MTFRVVTPPTTEQITLAEARLHLRVTDDGDSPPTHPDDTLIQALITAARDYCEQNLARSLAPQTCEVILDAFPDNEIQLPAPPITSIVSVTYVDTSEVWQTLSPTLYVFDGYQEPGWVLPLEGTEWPATAAVVNAVKVRYTSGYTLPTDIPNEHPLPSSLRAAMLLLIGNWYENREAVVIGTIQSELSFAVAALLRPYQIRQSLA